MNDCLLLFSFFGMFCFGLFCCWIVFGVVLVFFSCFSFLSLFFMGKPGFSPKKGIFVYLCVSLLCLFSLFLASPFSLSLSLSVSCSFLSSFLPVSHVSFWFLLFAFALLLLVSRCCFVFVFCLLSCFVGIIILDLFLLCILSSCCCCFLFFLLWYFV